MALALKTTNTELDALWRIVDGARGGSTTVRVDKEALRHLLQDHHELYTAAQKRVPLTTTD